MLRRRAPSTSRRTVQWESTDVLSVSPNLAVVKAVVVDKSSVRYLKSHEWAGLVGDIATVGITDFAVSQLTDLTYVELPKVGATVVQGERFGEVESVKAVSDLYSPVTGEVIEVNGELEEDVAPLSSDPFGKGWMVKVRVRDASAMDSLLDRAAYEAYCAAEAH